MKFGPPGEMKFKDSDGPDAKINIAVVLSFSNVVKAGINECPLWNIKKQPDAALTNMGYN